ncbi:hypothetical protein TVD_13095 [Thioalkalivibrio versutus]|uniref:Uncharacterized protein n=1 Tax=Thioalkalivibrio versutus TaxID=106634 RepID=A0A0G3G9M0_9GAMM|nr:hypothetical protein [Thioalkalivibrio versutus]AKJ96237.1 hypothetical protein TVD_13095 [Thioalkalivibrio versutus]
MSGAGRLTLIVVVLVAIWLAGSILWSGLARPWLAEVGVFDALHEIYGEPPRLEIQEFSPPIRKANINGVPIAIPSNYLALVGIEYKDQSTWAPRDPDTPKPDERTFEDEAHAFTLAVRWPDLKPRSPETRTSYWTKGDPDGDPWLQIGLGAYSNPDAIGRDLGWAPLVRGRIERIEERTHTRRLPPRNPTERWGGTEEVRIHYEMRGTDPETGLEWAEPMGPGTERFHAWNLTLHWKGDLDGYVSDMIECYNGQMPRPESRPFCRHRFTLPEWGAWVDFGYPRALLPQWREIRSDVRDLILDFEVAPLENAEEDL